MPWLKQEALTLFKLVDSYEQQGHVKSWVKIAEQIPGKSPRQCYDYYITHQTIQKGDKYHKWTEEETEKLLLLKEQSGSNWLKLREYFPTLSLNQLKNKYRDLTTKRRGDKPDGEDSRNHVNSSAYISKSRTPTFKPEEQPPEMKEFTAREIDEPFQLHASGRLLDIFYAQEKQQNREQTPMDDHNAIENIKQIIEKLYVRPMEQQLKRIINFKPPIIKPLLDVPNQAKAGENGSAENQRKVKCLNITKPNESTQITPEEQSEFSFEQSILDFW